MVNGGDLHLFEFKDEKLVFDVESDTLHTVDQIAWEAISLMQYGLPEDEIKEKLSEKYPELEISETFKEIYSLKARELLWKEPISKISPRKPVIKALCLNVAHTCNLACRYCFAGKGNYGGEELLMTPAVGKAAIDFLLEQSAGRKHVEIDYFGGEPLMNIDAVKEITSYAREKGKIAGTEFKFTLTTNGLLLTEEITNYFKNEGFSIVLSLDGQPETHDKMRKFPGGRGSYNITSEKIKEFVASWDDNYYIRGTYTRYNTDFSRDVIHMTDLGFRHISVEPVVSETTAEWSLQEENLPFLLKEYDKLTDYYLKQKKNDNYYTFFHFEIDLDNGPCIYKRLSGCGAGEEYLAVTPGGDLYPCHQLIGEDPLKMGNVLDKKGFKTLPADVFPPAGPLKEECKSCWARYYCGGGCRAASKMVNDNFSKPYSLECALQKKRLECSLYIKAKLASEI